MAGRWLYSVDLVDIWATEGITAQEAFPRVLKAFDEPNDYKALRKWVTEDEIGILDQILEELGETEYLGEFDEVWSEVIEWADLNRIWLKTF